MAVTERRIYHARLTSKGQLTMPRQVRRALGVESGDQVAFEIDSGGVTVRPVRGAGIFREFEGRWRAGSGEGPATTDAWLRDLRGHEDGAP